MEKHSVGYYLELKAIEYRKYPEYNTRVPCACIVRTANICCDGKVIGTISEEKNDAGEFDWVIKVDWDAWEKAGRPPISGIDTSTRQEEYITQYDNDFVTERTVDGDHYKIQDKIEAVGLKWNDKFEYMCRTHGKCESSRLTIERQT